LNLLVTKAYCKIYNKRSFDVPTDTYSVSLLPTASSRLYRTKL